MRMIRIVLALLAAVTLASAAELATKKALTLQVAKGIAAAAEEHGKASNWKVVIAIVDDGANLVYLQREDGVQIGSIEIAIRKAQTAVNFKQPSRAFADRLEKGATGLVALPGALPFEGGVPIVHESQVIGAIGVSGVTARQDGQIAQAGAGALPKILGK